MNPEDMRTAHAAQVPTSYKEQYHGYIRHKRLIIFLFALLLLVLVIVSITLGTADLIAPRRARRHILWAMEACMI